MTRARLNLNLILAMAMWLSLTSGGAIGSAAPYPCPSDMPVTVGYAIDGSISGVQSLGKTNPGVLAKIQQTAGATHYREVDVTTTGSNPPDDVDWAKAAWTALDKQHPPQWVASGPRGGWKSKALPAKPEDAEKALKAIMK